MEVKNQIRAYRSELGMSQEELAEAVYVTRQTVSNWETGKSYPEHSEPAAAQFSLRYQP